MTVNEFLEKVADGTLKAKDIISFCSDDHIDIVKDVVFEMWAYSVSLQEPHTINNIRAIERIDEAIKTIEKHFGFSFLSVFPQRQASDLKDLLPEKLKTDETVNLFQKAIDARLITYSPKMLKWNDTKQLLAYFATRVSETFNLTTRLDKDGNKTTDWKTFEILFGEQGLKGAKQNWMRLNTRFKPTGFEKVDALF